MVELRAQLRFAQKRGQAIGGELMALVARQGVLFVRRTWVRLPQRRTQGREIHSCFSAPSQSLCVGDTCKRGVIR